MSKVRYFFRDLDNRPNKEGGRSFHAAGIAEIWSNEPCPSGKDVCVTFVNPFTGYISRQWRTYNEIELFEAFDFEINATESNILKLE